MKGVSGMDEDEDTFKFSYDVFTGQRDIPFQVMFNVEDFEARDKDIEVRITSDNPDVVKLLTNKLPSFGILSFGKIGRANIACKVYRIKRHHHEEKLLKVFYATFKVHGNPVAKLILVPGAITHQ